MENCQLIDLKAYHFGEVTAGERQAAEAHLKTCEACRDELSRLQLLGATLTALREEEPPKRIAFVSDKVFEPTWWQQFWASGPKAGFAAAAMLACAILAHGFLRQQSPAGIDQRIAELEQRHQVQVQQVLAKYETQNRALALIADEIQILRKQEDRTYIQTAGLVKE